VTLSTTDMAGAAAQIRYTLGGSEPTATNGFLYDPNSPIAITSTTILRAATFVGNGTVLPSRVSTYSYIFLNAVLAQPASIPGFPNGIARDTGRLDVGTVTTVPLDMAMDPQIVSS
jgi:hypothetical protein